VLLAFDPPVGIAGRETSVLLPITRRVSCSGDFIRASKTLMKLFSLTCEFGMLGGVCNMDCAWFRNCQTVVIFKVENLRRRYQLEGRRSKAPRSGCDGHGRLLQRRKTLVAQLRLRTHQDHSLLPLHHPRAFKITRPNRSGIWMHLINETAKALEPKWLRKVRVSKLCISCFYCCVTTVSDSGDALTNLWEIIFTIWK
jgi:hypothetical protein